jgi:hypothetical protein
MAGQAGRGTFFLHIPGPSGPGCRIGAPLALANVGQRPINPIAQAIGLGCMGHIIAACRAAILFLMLMCMRVMRDDGLSTRSRPAAELVRHSLLESIVNDQRE